MLFRSATTKNTIHRKALVQIRQRNQKLYRQEKAKRTQHHQTSITTNAKGTSLGRKHKRTEQKRKGRKKTYKNKPERIKKMAIRTYISIITLNINRLNTPTKRHRLAERIQKQETYICCLQETHFR